MPFDGDTYEPGTDRKRLTRQLDAVRSLLVGHHDHWWTLREIAERLGTIHDRYFPEASVSARIRDLRKTGFGSWKVDKRRRRGAPAGTWEYRVNRAGEQTDLETYAGSAVSGS